jgi:hypothetical protein
MGAIKANTFEPYIPSAYDGNPNFILYHNSYASTDILLLTKNEYKLYNELVTKLLNKPVDTTLGKKVYLGKLSNLPRHKMKDFFTENHLKYTKISQADQYLFEKLFSYNLIIIYQYQNHMTSHGKLIEWLK